MGTLLHAGRARRGECCTDQGVQVGGFGETRSEMGPGTLQHLKHEVGLEVGTQVGHLVAQPVQRAQHPPHHLCACGADDPKLKKSPMPADTVHCGRSDCHGLAAMTGQLVSRRPLDARLPHEALVRPHLVPHREHALQSPGGLHLGEGLSATVSTRECPAELRRLGGRTGCGQMGSTGFGGEASEGALGGVEQQPGGRQGVLRALERPQQPRHRLDLGRRRICDYGGHWLPYLVPQREHIPACTHASVFGTHTPAVLLHRCGHCL